MKLLETTTARIVRASQPAAQPSRSQPVTSTFHRSQRHAGEKQAESNEAVSAIEEASGGSARILPADTDNRREKIVGTGTEQSIHKHSGCGSVRRESWEQLVGLGFLYGVSWWIVFAPDRSWAGQPL